jgi:flagellar hook-basal body complex protein FliE
MQIQSIANTAASALTSSTQKSGATTSFSDIFNEALNNAKETEATDQQGTLALLAGEDSGIHTTLIESQKAELALNLALQIRNKVVDAYNEVMRMQL